MEFSEDINNYFKSLDTQIVLFPENSTKSFDSLELFYDFVKNEATYWDECKEGISRQIRDHFGNLLNRLNNTISQNESTKKNEVANITSALKKNVYPGVFSSTSKAKLVRECYRNSFYQADAVCDYFFLNKVGNISNLEYFKGIMRSFYFSDNDIEMAVTSTIKSEKESLEDLHSQYNEKIEQLYKTFINKDVETKNLTQDYKNDIGELIVRVQADNNKLVRDGEEKFDNLIKQIEDTKVLYENQLSLSAPVAYWKNLSENYNERGKLWVKFSIVSTTVLALILLVVLYYLPNSLSEVNNKITYDNLKGTIIFALLVSIGVYIIRLFVKLALSSYHLARDAKEREQLTYVYLALIKEKAIATEERNIVLQAIFSRADTGLLKGDSSPTLPDGVVTQVLKNLNK